MFSLSMPCGRETEQLAVIELKFKEIHQILGSSPENQFYPLKHSVDQDFEKLFKSSLSSTRTCIFVSFALKKIAPNSHYKGMKLGLRTSATAVQPAFPTYRHNPGPHLNSCYVIYAILIPSNINSI